MLIYIYLVTVINIIIVFLLILQCLAAGSRIANHEIESIELKPYAIRLSKAISTLRKALREETQQYDEETNQQVFFSEHVSRILVACIRLMLHV